MPEINANFIAKAQEMSHALTALAYKDGILCPALVAFNDWLARAGITLAAIPPSTIATDNFDDAVLFAVQSSPNGVGLDDLRAILATYKKPANQIGLALARLVKKGLLTVAGTAPEQIWTFMGATTTGTTGTRRT